MRTSVQQLHGVGGGRGLAEGLGGDGQDPEGVAHTFGEAGDRVAGLLQTRSYDGPLDGAEGLLLDGKHQRGGIWSAERVYQFEGETFFQIYFLGFNLFPNPDISQIDRKTDRSVIAAH